MVFSKTLLTATFTLFALCTPQLNAMNPSPFAPSSSFLLRSVTPESILEEIKIQCEQSQKNAELFVRSLELYLLEAHGKELADITDSNGFNVLHLACIKGYNNVVRTLINTAHDAFEFISKKDKYEQTPLLFTVHHNHQDIIQMLLDAAGDNRTKFMNLMYDMGATVFHYAAQEGSSAALQKLIDAAGKEAGTFMFMQNIPLGMTPLHCAAMSGNAECFKLIMNWAKSNNKLESLLLAQNTNGNTVLHLAAREGHGNIVEIILDQDGYIVEKLIPMQNKNGNTATSLASVFCSPWYLLKGYTPANKSGYDKIDS